MATGICYTQSGGVKKYEQRLLSISPNRVKIIGFDNNSAEPFIAWVFTSDNHPSTVDLEEGTAMYVAALRDPDIDLSNYLTYTPPDGYELVSEDHQYDTGVKKYHVSKQFYCEPFTVYYGTAGKTINESLSEGKDFYYKKKYKPNIYKDYKVVFTISGGSLHCRCQRVNWIPGTNGGDFTLGINIELGDGVSHTESFNFEWKMKNGINESKPCRYNKYYGSGFTTQNSWEQDNGDGTKTYYGFTIDSP